MSNFGKSGQKTKKETNNPRTHHPTGIDINSEMYGKMEELHRSFFPKEVLKTILEFLKTLP